MTEKPYTDADVNLVAATFVAEAKKNPVEPGAPWLGVQTRMMLGPTEHDIAVAVLDALTAASWRPPLREPDSDVAGVSPGPRQRSGKFTPTARLGSSSPRAQDAEEVARLWHNTTQKLRHGRMTRDLFWSSLPQEDRDLLVEVATKQLDWFGTFARRSPSLEEVQLPAWVLELVRGLDRYELEHPELFRQMDAGVYVEWPCPAPLLALVPAEARRQAEVGDRDPHESEQALRDRLEHAIRDRLSAAWPVEDDDVFMDQVAAVAAVAAVNELTERQG